jgi:hypothetical protein
MRTKIKKNMGKSELKVQRPKTGGKLRNKHFHFDNRWVEVASSSSRDKHKKHKNNHRNHQLYLQPEYSAPILAPGVCRNMAAMIHSKKASVPLTVIGEEGSAKRNIIRKGGMAKARKDSAPGTNPRSIMMSQYFY